MREFVEIEVCNNKKRKYLQLIRIDTIIEIIAEPKHNYYALTYKTFDRTDCIKEYGTPYADIDDNKIITKESYEKLKSILEYKENQLATNCNQLKVEF